MRSHPAKHGEGFDAPPTLERSGSEHRRAVTSSLFGQERGLVRDVAYLFHILPHYLAYYETNAINNHLSHRTFQYLSMQ